MGTLLVLRLGCYCPQAISPEPSVVAHMSSIMTKGLKQ